MYFVPATQAASSGSFGLLLVLFITALLIAQNRANEKAKSESDHRLRMQAGLEATLAKLNPNFTPERKKGVTDADPSEAFQALLKHAASEPEQPSNASGDVIGAAAAKPKKPRAPRKRKPKVDPEVVAQEAAIAERDALATRHAEADAQLAEDALP